VFRDQEPETFIRRLARFLADLNAIHPFRGGNGRTQLGFAGLVGDCFDEPLHLERVRQSTLLPAMIASSAGNLEPLIQALDALRE
jgi:cell filamentation protein